MSVAEYRTIQQFPADFGLAGSLHDKYRQIGNAVSVRLAREVGKGILAVARNEHRIETRRNVRNPLEIEQYVAD